ncbi:hypothetical protein NNJEOMEG_03879 [Fundidesulfovibrio magnetotacticus]|uniref:Uncharacterized protein n=1 Tax=Fundidesulfovibrio magnetotacticus TaxID=2730080 RepID=A0A6V8M5Y0_9BACT|nr:hypothetical protein [Fundidesulfovibrio magnetotacticus]GFK96005.1 hypothetical protein NNJEOMEG_03879 [Fundidesulfovibrio magnetotacticus]
MGTTPAFPGLPAATAARALVNADATAFVTLHTAIAAGSGGKGVLLGRLRAASDNASAITLQFARQVSGTDYVLGEVQAPAGAGTDGATAWVDVLASLNSGLPLTLSPGEALRVRAKVAVTSGKRIDITAEVAPL